jgi:hypothetical protein
MGIILGSGGITGQRQYADEADIFDVTLAVADTAEDVVTPPVGKTGRIISLVNEGPGKVFLTFDGTATTADLALDKRDMYSESDVSITTNISFVGEAGKTPRVRGVLWSN